MTNKKSARDILAIIESHADLQPHEVEAIQVAAQKLAPTRRISVGPDPIQAIRDGHVTSPQQAVAAYNEARRRAYGETDPTIAGREYASALIRSRLMIRKEFNGDPERAAIFFVRAVRWFRLRERANRWPGNSGAPTFDRITHPKIVQAFLCGEIDRDIR